MVVFLPIKCYNNKGDRKMSKDFLKGVITPMFTPCNEDDSLDETGIRAYVDFLKDKKVIKAIFPRCGVGKMYAFSFEEIKTITEIVIDQAGGELAVIPGTAGVYDQNPEHKPSSQAYTEQTIELSNYARERGAEGVVLVVPSALKPKSEEKVEETIFNYYREVSANCNLPIIIYQPPGLEKEYSITPELLKELIKLKNIAGMKYSTTNLESFGRIAEVVRDKDFNLIAGAETVFLSALSLGAVGVIGGGCNFCPEVLNSIYENFKAGKIKEAQIAQDRDNRLLSMCEGIDSALFTFIYAKRLGYEVKPYSRRGDKSIPEDRYKEIEEALEKAIAPYRQ